MKSKERIQLTNWEKIHHYSTSLGLLIPSAIFGYLSILNYQSISNQKENDYVSIIATILFFGSSIVLFFLQKKRTHFEEYKGKLSNEEFKQAVKVTAKELGWHVEKLTNNFAKAYRPPEPLGNGEEQITIKKTKEKVFVNSIGSPVGGRNGFSSKRNKQNMSYFAINAGQILKGNNIEQQIEKKLEEKEEKFWQENEWSFGNVMMRITGYGLFLFFLSIGIYGILEGAYEGILPIIISIVIGFVYIRADLKILKEKRKRNK